MLSASRCPATLLALESAVLHSFFYATGGPNWTEATGWLQGDVCKPHKMESSWAGVACDDCHVFSIIRTGKNLEGHIPEDLMNLTQLSNLELYWNQLKGSLPQRAPTGTSIHVNLQGNQLSGHLPLAWAQCPEMQTLNLANNRLNGPLPDDWRKSVKLHVLDLSGNDFSGFLPSWGLPPNLRYLHLHKNRLHGRLPDEWAQRTLKVLLLADNCLTGPLPEAWGNISSLVFLSLQSNQLVGDASRALKMYTQWTKLEGLLLHNNSLSGSMTELPPSLFMPKSKTLSGNGTALLLFGNHFSCQLPNRAMSNADLHALVLPGNRFSLPGAPELDVPWYFRERNSPLAVHGWTSTIIACAPLLCMLLTTQLAVSLCHWRADPVVRGSRSVRLMMGKVPLQCSIFVLLDAFIIQVCVFLWPGLKLYSCPPVLMEWSIANLRLEWFSLEWPWAILSFLFGTSSCAALTYGFHLRKLCGRKDGADAIGWTSVLAISSLIFFTVLLHSFFALVKSIPEEFHLKLLNFQISLGVSQVAGLVIPVLSFAMREVIVSLLAQHLPDQGLLQSFILLLTTLVSWVVPMTMNALLGEACFGGWRKLWSGCIDPARAKDLEVWFQGKLVAEQSDFCSVPARGASGSGCIQSMAEVALKLLLPKLTIDACWQMFQVCYPKWRRHFQLCAAWTCKKLCRQRQTRTPCRPLLDWEFSKTVLKVQSAVQIAIIFGAFIPIVYLLCLVNVAAHLLRWKGLRDTET